MGPAPDGRVLVIEGDARTREAPAEKAFHSLMEATECVILIMRHDLSIVYFSPFAERISGYTAAEAMGRNGAELLQLQRAPGVTEDVVRRLRAGEAVRGIEDEIICRDGTRRSMFWNARPLDDYEGAPAFLAIGLDMTCVKQAQAQALQAERLAAIGQIVTGLGHEGRNALQRCQACLEMLRLAVPDRPAALDLIGRLQRAQDDLRRLFDDVRSYAAPLRLECRWMSLADVWRAAWSQLPRPARDQARLVEPPDAGPHCEVDPFRIEQVFRNIFDNALAAGRPPVVVTLSCIPGDHEGQPVLVVVVADNGGLSAEARRRLFEPFYTTKVQGTGLGMAVVRRIVEAHGGTVDVGADHAAGTEICLVLPRRQP